MIPEYTDATAEVRRKVKAEIDTWINGGRTTEGEEAWWCRLCQTGMTGVIAQEVQLSAVAHVLGPDHAAQHVLNGEKP